MNNEVKGSELIFISRIKRDGSGVSKRIKKRTIEFLSKETFKLNRLSLTEDTWIASGFNSFVVRKKNNG